MLTKLKDKYTVPGLIICALGLAALAALYLLWFMDSRSSALGKLAALASVALFALVCLRFVPGWMRFWTPDEYSDTVGSAAEPAKVRAKLFALGLIWCLAVFVLTYFIYLIRGYNGSWASFSSFWTLTDSGHYLDIARDWYLSEGVIDRLVQLVFLPGYPIAVRAMHLIVPDWVLAGLLVSWLSFSGALSVGYSLLRLDYSHSVSMRAIKYLLLIPGSFFFVSPMSESLFLLLSLGCVYLARTGKLAPGCLLGGLAAFTRSLGLMLFVPVCMELVHEAVNAPKGQKRIYRFAWLLLILAGFAAYCYINYLVAGDPFQYMTYQSEHWGQNFGLFFNTASYQLENALSSLKNNPHNFLGLWLPNLVFDFASLAFMVSAARKMRPGYTAWFIAYYFIAIGATWLLSSPRYMISLLPFFLSVALTADTPKKDRVITAVCVPLWLYYEVMFVLRWQVW